MNVEFHAGFFVFALLALAAASVPLARTPRGPVIIYGAAAAIAAIAALSGAIAAARGIPLQVRLPLGLPGIGVRLQLDALSSIFALIVNLAAALASLYAVGYGRHEHEQGRVLPFYCLFLLGMNLVLVADDAFTFLIAWEFMSLSSWALVLVHHKSEVNRNAGFLYLTMAAIGTLALLFVFGMLAGGAGGYAFDAIRAQELNGFAAGVTLLLALVGTGSKAGLVPLHAWLPPAHSAAPSHVSALMSGVMTKVAVYGFIRIVFDLLGAPDWWWGTLVLVLGGITAVLGVLYALMQHDLKRLLAYHTVENIGIIFIGLGLALAFKYHGMTGAAALAATAAIFHVFNHCIFKSLLFFGAGAVQTATGTRDMDHLGGLIHRMPGTSFLFLVGCVAISALPPLNGFVSEWLTFQVILLSPELPDWGLKFSIPAVGALLALSAALAAACFVKAFGVTFLGRARTPEAAAAGEVDRYSLAAMGVLAALCLLAGIFPGVVIDILAPTVTSIVGGRMPVQTEIAWLTIVPIAESRSSYNGLILFLFIAFAAYVAVYVIHRLASDAVRRGPAWDCGFPDPRPQTQYSASSFAQPIRRVYGTLVFRAREIVDMPRPGDLRAARFSVRLRDLIWDWFYAPVVVGVTTAADLLNPLQFQTIRRYLALVFTALVTVLTVVALWQ
ncbi:MAG: hydrogenase 4 subunit B [Bradyrhizobiaceae bacterium]|nr:hydrogenase 4 subunit B [Bradyrhizobiaceae bacterium]